MADQDKKATNPAPSGSDPDRSAILKRRQKFIAAAVVGLAATGTGCIDACEDWATGVDQRSDTRPRACLKKIPQKTTKQLEAKRKRAAKRAARWAKQAAQEERAGKQKAKQKQTRKSGGKR